MPPLGRRARADSRGHRPAAAAPAGVPAGRAAERNLRTCAGVPARLRRRRPATPKRGAYRVTWPPGPSWAETPLPGEGRAAHGLRRHVELSRQPAPGGYPPGANPRTRPTVLAMERRKLYRTGQDTGAIPDGPVPTARAEYFPQLPAEPSTSSGPGVPEAFQCRKLERVFRYYGGRGPPTHAGA